MWQVTLPLARGNMLATVTRGPIAIIPGEQDCAAQPNRDGNSVEPTYAGNGLYVVPEAYTNDIIARYAFFARYQGQLTYEPEKEFCLQIMNHRSNSFACSTLVHLRHSYSFLIL
jgi:hypothetical protein